MTQFPQTVLEIGDTGSVDKAVNAKDVVPCAAAVRKAFVAKAHQLRK